MNVVAGTGRRCLHMEMWIRSFVGQHLSPMQGRDGLGWLNKPRLYSSAVISA